MPIKLRSLSALAIFKLYAFVVVCSLGFWTPSFSQKNKKPDNNIVIGTASWYSDHFHGKKTSSGETFSQQKMTCASNRYKVGTWLLVTNLKNGKSVKVKVNDRMGARTKRIVDLTRAAAKHIGIIGTGLARVSVQNLGSLQPK